MQESLFKITSSKQAVSFFIDILINFFIWVIALKYFGYQNEYQIIWIPLLIKTTLYFIEGAYEINPIWQSYSQRKAAITILINLILTFVLSKYFINLLYQNFFISGEDYFKFCLLPQFLLIYLSRRTLIISKIIFPQTQSILIIGTEAEARYLASFLKQYQVKRTNYKIIKAIDLNTEIEFNWETKSSSQYIKKNCFHDINQYDVIVTFKGQNFDTREARRLMDFSAKNGFVLDLATFCGSLEPTYPIDYINTKWILDTSFNLWFKLNIYLRLRRFIDTVISFVSIFLTLPLTIPVSLIIKLSSKGPVFYTQERVGLLGKKFNVIKFRSMYTDAEKDGPQMASSNDSRITPIGKFIRKTRIDEIPQFINVLKGDMALIGPRPEREYFEEVFKSDLPLLELRNIIRPGITGLAQSRAKYANDITSYKSKLGYDIYYIKNLSPLLDLSIILQTIRTIITKKGQ